MMGILAFSFAFFVAESLLLFSRARKADPEHEHVQQGQHTPPAPLMDSSYQLPPEG
jgi:hypothetical protein